MLKKLLSKLLLAIKMAVTKIKKEQLDLAGLLDYFYPVGTVHTTTNPDLNTVAKMNAHFGGTWEAYGAGRVVVAIDTGQTEFDVIGETGGEKTHTLTVEELAYHRHTPVGASSQNRFVVSRNNPSNQGASSGSSGSYWDGISSANAYTGYTGSNSAHNNLPPYIVAYRYRRVA